MTKLKKRAAQMATAIVLVGGAMVVPATAAQAKPARCSGTLNGNVYKVLCLGGTGQYRAYVDCWKIRGNTYVARKGPWRSVFAPLTSQVECLSDEEPGTHFAELRD